MTYRVEVEWKVQHIEKCFYEKGISRIQINAKNKLEAINKVIDISEMVASCDFEKNGIDRKRYVENCQVKYIITLSKIISIEKVSA